MLSEQINFCLHVLGSQTLKTSKPTENPWMENSPERDEHDMIYVYITVVSSLEALILFFHGLLFDAFSMCLWCFLSLDVYSKRQQTTM